MNTMWEKIKKGLKEGATLSMEKIEEYTKISKLKIDELAAKHKIERNKVDIGERALDLIADGRGRDIENDLAVKKAIDTIASLKQEIAVIVEKIKAIREEARKAHGADADDDEINGV